MARISRVGIWFGGFLGYKFTRSSCRHSPVHVAAGVQSGVHRDLSGGVYGVDDRVRIRGVPAKVPRDPVQSGQESSQCLHGVDRRAGRLHRNLRRWLHPEAVPAEAEGGRPVCAGLQLDLFGLLRAVVLLGLRESQNGWHDDTVLQQFSGAAQRGTVPGEPDGGVQLWLRMSHV